MPAPTDTSLPDAPFRPLDLDLLAKYAVPGPRYTSYPPANKFHDNPAHLDLGGAIDDDNHPSAGDGPLSLYIHLPFCESRCWFCGCTTIITRRRDWAYAYLDDLVREIELVTGRLSPRRKVTQLHLGGGTPTFFPADALARLGDVLRSRFRFAGDAELSVEVDPRRVTKQQIRVLRRWGVNRASLGIQDTNPAVQKAINRIQPQAQNRQVVDWLREEGITAINLDLIYGLPLQTEDSVGQSLSDALDLTPDRLSVFSYAHVPWIKPAQRIFVKRGQLPAPQEKLAMFARLRGGLLRAGYVDVGLDHFASPEDELARARMKGGLHRNFQGYSTRSGASLYGFGISAISQTPDTYRQNHKSLAQYRAALAQGELPVERGYRLSKEDKRRRRLIMAIMCDRKLDFADLSEELEVDIRVRYATEIESLTPMVEDRLVSVNSDGLRVLPAGEPLLRVVAMAFDETFSASVPAHALTV